MFVIFILILSILLPYSSSVSNETTSTFATVPAFDTTLPINPNDVHCLLNEGYKVGFFRLGVNGKDDEIGALNVKLAYAGQMKCEGYITPNPYGSGAQQFDQLLQLAARNNITVHGIWLQITDPLTWDRCQSCNVKFIQSFVREAQTRKVNVGYYTNWYDYEQITGNSMQVPLLPLWYWNVNHPGEAGKTLPTFLDFEPFGPFRNVPRAKQYVRRVEVCGVILNRNSFETPALRLRDGEMGIGEGVIVRA